MKTQTEGKAVHTGTNYMINYAISSLLKPFKNFFIHFSDDD